MNITIERFKKNDTDKLFEFRHKVFPNNARRDDRKLWTWRYLTNPASNGNIPVWVIKNENRIVGSIASTDTRMKVGERIYLASFGNDYFIDKEFLGLPALRLLKTMLAEYEISIAAYVSESAKKLFLKMGHLDLSKQLECYSMSLMPPLRFKSHVKHAGLKFLRRIMAPVSYETNVATEIPGGVSDLWTRIQKSEQFCVVKDIEYLSWRYVHCPNVKYEFISLRNNGFLKALGVVAIREWSHIGVKQGVIMDMLVPETDTSSLLSLLETCLAYFREEKCTECFTHVTKGWMRNSLSIMGFYRGVSDIGFLVYTSPAVNGYLSTFDLKLMHFYLGDTDVL